MDFLKPLKFTSILNRKRKDPGNYSFTGDNSADAIDIQLFRYNRNECNEIVQLSPDAIETFENNQNISWLNVYGLHESDLIASICKTQGIHDLTIQDILDVAQRPKFQEYEGFSFLTIKSIVPSDGFMLTEQISFILGANYLISFQERKADFFDHLRYRLRENMGIIRERGADYLLYNLLESILDNYFKTINKLDEEIESFDFSDDSKELSPDVLAIIENNKKIVHFVKKSILPIKEFAQAVERGDCQFIEKRHLKYFLEIKDMCLTLIDNSDILISALESSTNLFFSVQGHRMNQVMKTLTVVATIFIPLTFVAGIYGMNFVNMPELGWKYGYIGVWVIIVLIVAAMILYFKKKKWF
jgi:magnesium transporter